MAAGIYLVTCTANGTRYVGSSKNIPYRWWKHKSDLRLGRHENPRWQNTWNKYGADAFEWAVLEEVEDEKKLCEREQHWIDILHPELNVYPCADYNYMSEEERKTHAEKIANGQRNRWARLTPKEKKKISVPITRKDRNVFRDSHGLNLGIQVSKGSAFLPSPCIPEPIRVTHHERACKRLTSE